MLQETQPESQARKCFCPELGVLERDTWDTNTTKEHQPKPNHCCTISRTSSPQLSSGPQKDEDVTCHVLAVSWEVDSGPRWLQH